MCLNLRTTHIHCGSQRVNGLILYRHCNHLGYIYFQFNFKYFIENSYLTFFFFSWIVGGKFHIFISFHIRDTKAVPASEKIKHLL